MPDRTSERNRPDLPPLGFADRARAALHVLRTGDYRPAAAYLRGHRHGLDSGIALAWREFRYRFPEIGPPPRP